MIKKAIAALRNNYLPAALTLLLAISYCTAGAQIKQNYPGYGMHVPNRFAVDGAMQIPRLSIGVKDNNGGFDTAQLKYNAVDSSVYIHTGYQFIKIGDGAGFTNLNIGSGYRLAVPGSNNVKTLFSGYALTVDSTTNTNAITEKVDSSSAGLSAYFERRKDSATAGNLNGYLTRTNIITTGIPLSSIKPATSTSAVDHSGFSQDWAWDGITTQIAMKMRSNSITTGTILDLYSSAETMTANSEVLNIHTDNLSGISSKINTAERITMTNTGTGTVNTGLVIDVSGASSNNALIVSAGNVGLGTNTPAYPLSIVGDINLTGVLRALTTQFLWNPGITGSSVYGNASSISSSGGGTNGQYNTVVGQDAANSLTVGYYNTIIGGLAGYYQTKSTRMTAVGLNAARGQAPGDSSDYLVAVGLSALQDSRHTHFSVAVGPSALIHGDSVSYSTAIGVNALHENKYGVGNTAIGLDALWNNLGSYNTSLGRGSLRNNVTGNLNTAIGYKAQLFPYNSDSTLNICNGILGVHMDGVDSTIMTNGLIGIGVIPSTHKLEVAGGIKATSITSAWIPRIGTTTSSATPTINTDNVDIYQLTAQAADITSFTTNLSGTPYNGQVLEIQITGTAARAITWGSSFVASTISLPTTTVTTATLSVFFQWSTNSSYGSNKWVCANSY